MDWKGENHFVPTIRLLRTTERKATVQTENVSDFTDLVFGRSNKWAHYGCGHYLAVRRKWDDAMKFVRLQYLEKITCSLFHCSLRFIRFILFSTIFVTFNGCSLFFSENEFEVNVFAHSENRIDSRECLGEPPGLKSVVNIKLTSWVKADARYGHQPFLKSSSGLKPDWNY